MHSPFACLLLTLASLSLTANSNVEKASSEPSRLRSSSLSSSPSSNVAERAYKTAKTIHRTLQQVGADADAGDGAALDSNFFCTLVELALGDDFVEGDGTGSCTCSGDFTSSIELKCSMSDVCGGADDVDQQTICGDVDFTLIMSGLWDSETMSLGDNPTMEIGSCMLIDSLSFLTKEWCVTLSYHGTDFAVPKECNVTYGEEDCTCDIDAENICYTWNCADAVKNTQPLLADHFQSSTCLDAQFEEIDTGSFGSDAITGESGSSTVSLLSFVPAMEQIPDDVEIELTSNGNDIDNSNSGGVAITSKNRLLRTLISYISAVLVAGTSIIFI